MFAWAALCVVCTAVLAAPAFARAAQQTAAANRSDSAIRTLPPSLRSAVRQAVARDAGYPLRIDAPDWLEEQEITADDGASNDEFGISVALHGDTAMVGSRQATIDGVEDQGAVYVFKQSGGVWTQTQKLTADDGAAFDTFGNSVAFSGTTAFIGAFAATVGDNMFQGAAYVFTLSNGTWSQTQKLTSDDGQGFDYFGYSVAFNGTTAFVGADAATVGDNGAQGAVYVFNESGGVWTQAQKLLASDGGTGDIFGYSIAVDGATAVIGAYANNFYQGAAYVFGESGGSWSEVKKLTADDGTANNMFGYSAAISGTNILVGAWGVTVNGNDTQGAAYVFAESNGTWSQVQKLVADDGAPFDDFGHAVALDGTHALVGADGVAQSQGAVYAFDESGGTWSQSQEFFASDGAPFEEFGSAVTLDGTRALAGSWGWTTPTTFSQGSAYFFVGSADDVIFESGFDGETP
jgi:FG-GAP repeat protein